MLVNSEDINQNLNAQHKIIAAALAYKTVTSNQLPSDQQHHLDALKKQKRYRRTTAYTHEFMRCRHELLERISFFIPKPNTKDIATTAIVEAIVGATNIPSELSQLIVGFNLVAPKIYSHKETLQACKVILEDKIRVHELEDIIEQRKTRITTIKNNHLDILLNIAEINYSI
jgi:hypothetical protein